MVYGKTQTSFRLLTEETAIKWRLPVTTGGPATAIGSGGEIYAGMVVYLDGTNEFAIAMPANTAVGNTLIGVTMDDYNSNLDETQGSGFITVVLGPHIGTTNQYTTSGTAVIGSIVLNPVTAGWADIGTVTGNYSRLGNVLNIDNSTGEGVSGAQVLTGYRLTYWWSKT